MKRSEAGGRTIELFLRRITYRRLKKMNVEHRIRQGGNEEQNSNAQRSVSCSIKPVASAASGGAYLRRS